jgi:hypothetical protein
MNTSGLRRMNSRVASTEDVSTTTENDILNLADSRQL